MEWVFSRIVKGTAGGKPGEKGAGGGEMGGVQEAEREDGKQGPPGGGKPEK